MRSPQKTTTAAALAAALAGAAVAGTFAGAAGSGSTSTTTTAKTTTTAGPLTAAQKAALAKKKKAAALAASRRRTTVRVIVKRGLQGVTGPDGEAGPAGPAGPQGPAGPAGPAANDVARSLSLNWKGDPTGRDTAAIDIPEFGRLVLTCNPGTRELRLTPSRTGVRTVLSADVYFATNSQHIRKETPGALVIGGGDFPVSGLINATISAEPVGGDGGGDPIPPATLTLSVESKSNADPSGDPGVDFNFCYAAAQVLQAAN